MKKIISLVPLLALCLLLAACGAEPTTAENAEEYKLVKIYDKGSLQEYVDTETGVHYFVISSGYSATVTPRYDADGNIYIEKEDKQ